MERLHSTCRLPDGIHWMLMRPNGFIFAVSSCAFRTVEDALKDLGISTRK